VIDTTPIPTALLDRLLRRVERPARYTNAEWNAVVRPWEAAKVHLVLAFADVYEVGMSNLGMSILYDIVNRQPGMLAERAYAPWPDMAAALQEAHLPLFSLESRRPLAAFDVVGFSLGYELNFTTMLKMLSLARLPLRSAERTDALPLVIAGGAACYNPEPIWAFCDLVVIGDGEEALVELLLLYSAYLEQGIRANAQNREGKTDFLARAARLEGVYVPEFYEPQYSEGGRFLGLRPVRAGVPLRVRSRTVMPLPWPPTKPVVPYVEVVHDRATIEVRRGCGQGCRFCQAGMVYRPVRERFPHEIIAAAKELLLNTGYDELGLLSLSTCDYRGIEKLIEQLQAELGEEIAISLPSLRLDSFSVQLAERVEKRRRPGLTFAPEAGTQRLRDVINKKVTEEQLYEVAELVFSRGWRRIKLYFMIGLPTETDEDVYGIVHLCRRVLAIGRRHHGNRASVSVSVATFIPKPHTPFQWVAYIAEADLQCRLDILRRGLRKAGLELSWHDPRMSYVEAVLARGDRRCAAILEQAYTMGAWLDPWDEHFRWQAWQEALHAAAFPVEDYVRSPWPLDAPLPWEFIDTGVHRSFLQREYARALEGQLTPDCFEQCSGCGVSQARAIRCWE